MPQRLPLSLGRTRRSNQGTQVTVTYDRRSWTATHCLASCAKMDPGDGARFRPLTSYLLFCCLRREVTSVLSDHVTRARAENRPALCNNNGFLLILRLCAALSLSLSLSRHGAAGRSCGARCVSMRSLHVHSCAPSSHARAVTCECKLPSAMPLSTNRLLHVQALTPSQSQC